MFVLSSCKKDKSPTIKIDSCIELGDVFFGDTLKCAATCHNIGDKVIVLDFVRVPCGCITAYPKSPIINPGDSTQIIITYKPLDFGYTEQNMFAYFRDYETPIHFMLKCTIKDRE